MGHLRSSAACEIELAEVRLTNLIPLCGLASAEKFTAPYCKTHNLSLTYCGGYVLFSRPGECSEAVPIHLVLTMKGADDFVNVDKERAEIAAAKGAEQAARQFEERQKKEAASAKKLAEQAASAAAKLSNPAFGAEAIQIVEDDEQVQAQVKAPRPVAASEMVADMAAERGSTMDDSEKRSMEAAIARANKGRKR